MARQVDKLTARTVATLKTPGRHSDGAGLYLVVDKSGAKRWVFIYRERGTSRLREMGLGSTLAVSLAKARELAAAARALLADGLDPIAARAVEASTVPTFGDYADKYVDTIAPSLRNAKHVHQWRVTLREYAAPLRSRPLDEITTADVLAVLQPIWTTKNETASRLRGRIERVLDAAKVEGLRTGENPALWRGHLSHVLPKRQRLARGHHPAMPYHDVPAFMAKLRGRKAVSARALEFTILTAARSGETFGATWREIDMKAGLWTIPDVRMKAGKAHRVPLSGRAMSILKEMAKAGTDPDRFVFPGTKAGAGLSNMALDMSLRRLGGEDYTVHGFRSSFRDWAGDETHFPREIIETALAHQLGDRVEAAYRRGDALEKRRELMDAWAAYCATPVVNEKAQTAA